LIDKKLLETDQGPDSGRCRAIADSNKTVIEEVK
jgi:hypothetical protein